MSILDKIRKSNPKLLPALVLAAAVLLTAFFVLSIYLPNQEEKNLLEDEVTKLQKKVEEDRVKVRKLAEMKEANEKLNQDLIAAQKILPAGEEFTGLLETISDLVKASGLELINWQKVKSTNDASGLYAETVLTYDVKGSFHELGKFMERLDGLPRLVTVTDLNMSAAKLEGYEMSIPTQLTIVAYSAAGGN